MGQESSLITKISPLIDGQVPDYIQADHPIFVQFLRQYYKFLESAQMTITGTLDQVLLETVSTSYITLDGTDRFNSNESNKIVFDSWEVSCSETLFLVWCLFCFLGTQPPPGEDKDWD